MNRTTSLLAGAFLAISELVQPAAASDATLVLRLSGLPGANPEALDIDTNLPVSRMPAAGDWTYQLDFGEGQILKRLRLTIANAPTSDTLSNLSINYPFFRKGDLLLVLAPPGDRRSGSDAARQLWSTSVTDMSSDKLLQFYQRAKLVAEQRTDDWEVDWIDVHPYDIQSTFKYLESVVELSKQLYVVPPDDVSRARDWLNGAITNATDAVEKGVGLPNAKTLVNNIDKEEGARFGRLWEAIKVERCDKRQIYLQAYKKWFLTVSSDQRRERIVEVTGVPLASIDSAIAECVADFARTAAASASVEKKEAAKTELTNHLDSLQRTLSVTSNEALTRKLNSDISVLTGLRSLF
jgi:hypothetical protein